MNVILGNSASSGIGIGTVFILPEIKEKSIPKVTISDDQKSGEWERFTKAVSQVQEQINKDLTALTPDNLQRIIFETYLLMLSDPVFTKEVEDSFFASKFNIEHILSINVDSYAEKLRSSGNDYLAERSQDIEDVYGQVLDILLDYHPFNIDNIPDGCVIAGKELKAADTIVLSKRKIAGLVLTEGGVSSHVAILARNFGIPAVVGIPNISNQIAENSTLIVDGTLGEVIINPDESTIFEYKTKIQTEEKKQKRLALFKDKKALSEDGTEFHLYANIGTPEEAQIALDNGADGIGLFRTEFLFMSEIQKSKLENSSFSKSVSEEEQFLAYKKVLEIMDGRPVTIRTLDAGGDKLIDLKEINKQDEKNPLMGLRAIRLSLFYPHIFRTQLRALYRASVYGNLRIMIPLVTGVSQVETVKGIARGVMMELKSEGIPFKEDVPLGIMVETAAAAICSDCLAPLSDFFSIGTNDLTQYTLGVDRENSSVAPYYNEFNLAVLRLIDITIKNADKKGIPVSVCGEMAGRQESAIVLAGMGIRNLSMSPKQIPIMKETLSQFTIQELQNICQSSLY